MPTSTPPRLPRWLLERLLPPNVRGESIRGDLLEEMTARAERTSLFRARFWYSAQALAVVAHALAPKRNRPYDPSIRKASLMESLVTDVKFGLRSLIKARGFTATAIIALALGIGASTAVFSVANAVLLKPLPYSQPDRLMWLTEIDKSHAVISTSWPDFRDWLDRQQTFEDMAGVRRGIMNWTGAGDAERLTSRSVTSNFFLVLRVQPAIGRMFTPAEDRVGGPPVVLISDALWRRRFDASPGALGRVMTLGGVAHEIIGVLPAGLRYNQVTDDDVFVSLGQEARRDTGLLERGNHNGLSVIGRLREGVTEAAARQDLERISTSLMTEYPVTNADVHVQMETLTHRLVGEVVPMISVLFGAVAFLLLLSMVNVANLLVARGVSRRHELSVRAALGCGRWRMIRQLLVESTMLAIAGGAMGVLVCAGLVRLFLATAPLDMPRLQDVGMSSAAWAFAFAASTVAALLLGMFPGIQSSTIRGQHAIVRANRGDASSASAHRLRRGLMVIEVALAIVLLTGAGLMTRTMYALSSIDPGFDASHVLTLRFSVVGDRSTQALQDAFNQRVATFGDQIIEHASAVPGVERAALALSLPIEGSQWGSVFIVGDQPIPARADLPVAAFAPVSAGYFETMRMGLRAGRFFNATDTGVSQKTAVVNEAFARHFWPSGTAIGKRVKQSWPEDHSPWREIVGVVNDVKLEGVEADTPLQVYLPFSQEPTSFAALLVRTTMPPATLATALTRAVHDLDPNLPVFSVQTLDELMRASVTRRRMTMVIFGGFALVALVLASVGLYGVVSQGVAERTREVGVRIALGATRMQVIQLFVGQGVITTAIGALFGIGSALALSRLAQDLLFQVTPTDPLSFIAATTLLMVVSIGACYLPARRATRVNPTAALRGD